MSQTIRNLAQLQKAAEKQCYYLADKVADKVKANIEEDEPCGEPVDKSFNVPIKENKL